MKNSDLLLLVGAALLLLTSKRTPSPSQQSNSEALNAVAGNPLASGNYSNEQEIYNAVKNAPNAAAALAAARKVASTPAPTTYRETQTSSMGTEQLQKLVTQTSLKKDGGGSGLKEGSYNFGGKVGTVTVKNVKKEDSIAYKKGYIK